MLCLFQTKYLVSMPCCFQVLFSYLWKWYTPVHTVRQWRSDKWGSKWRYPCCKWRYIQSKSSQTEQCFKPAPVWREQESGEILTLNYSCWPLSVSSARQKKNYILSLILEYSLTHKYYHWANITWMGMLNKM